MVENGMPPQQVADIVFGAIIENQFYTLPAVEEYLPLVQTRHEDIIQQRNPSAIPRNT